MSEYMSREFVLFAKAFWYGSILLIAYDALRILRRCIRHGWIAVAAEDLVYWTYSAVYLFAKLYRENSGIVRGYFLLGLLAGMALYHRIASPFAVKYGSAALRKLLKAAQIPLKVFKKVIKRLKFWAFRFKLLISVKVSRQKCSKEERYEEKTQTKKKKCRKGSQLPK